MLAHDPRQLPPWLIFNVGQKEMMSFPELFRDYRIWIAVAVVVFIAISSLLRLRKPKERSFRCAKCKRSEDHSHRTIEAWRDGKDRFFCRSCHQAWLRSRPEEIRPEKAGCLPLLVIGFCIAGAIAYKILES